MQGHGDARSAVSDTAGTHFSASDNVTVPGLDYLSGNHRLVSFFEAMLGNYIGQWGEFLHYTNTGGNPSNPRIRAGTQGDHSILANVLLSQASATSIS